MRGAALGLAALVVFACQARAQEQGLVVPLWAGVAPGSEGKTGDETVRLNPQGEHIVSHVLRPTLTVYLPAQGKATGGPVRPSPSRAKSWRTRSVRCASCAAAPPSGRSHRTASA